MKNTKQENYKNEKDWKVRREMIEQNNLLATQENYDKEGSNKVKDLMLIINKTIKS